MGCRKNLKRGREIGFTKKVTGEVKRYTEPIMVSESRGTSDKPGFKSKER